MVFNVGVCSGAALSDLLECSHHQQAVVPLILPQLPAGGGLLWSTGLLFVLLQLVPLADHALVPVAGEGLALPQHPPVGVITWWEAEQLAALYCWLTPALSSHLGSSSRQQGQLVSTCLCSTLYHNQPAVLSTEHTPLPPVLSLCQPSHLPHDTALIFYNLIKP